MKTATLERLAPFLNLLRAHPALREVRPAAFHLDGRDFVHFHDEPEGILADVRLSKGRVHMRVSSPAEQAEFLERIEDILASLEERVRGRERRGPGGGRTSPGW